MGVFAALVTPLKADLTLDLDGLARLIEFLAARGCHGILLMGTTGEGPSLSSQERLQVFQTAVEVRNKLNCFQLLAGTGTPSLDETISLTKIAFNYGMDGAVVLPPYYFRKATPDGLFKWYSHLLEQAVPSDGMILGYHIPLVTGVSLSIELLSRLLDAYPGKFIGVKDSSGDPEWARTLGERFGTDLVVLNGNDRLFSYALRSKATGCITAMANLFSPIHRNIWDKHESGINDELMQEKLSQAREVFDKYPPMPALIKAILARQHAFPVWKVKPPLVEFDPVLVDNVLDELNLIMGMYE
jgi:4-hydroxy-tetrahydrodipicolinate synthase